jgi:hypothetical protein
MFMAVALPQGFKFLIIFNTEIENVWNFPFHVLHNTLYRIGHLRISAPHLQSVVIDT